MPPPKKRAKKKTASVVQRNLLSLKGTDEFKDWLDGLAKRTGAPVTVTIERALRELAERVGYPPAPDRY